MKLANVKRLFDFIGLLRYEEKLNSVKRYAAERDLATGAKKPESK